MRAKEKFSRQSILTLVIAACALSSVIWMQVSESGITGAASGSVKELMLQVDRLERREAALAGALSAWRATGLIPAKDQLVKLGMGMSEIDRAEQLMESSSVAQASPDAPKFHHPSFSHTIPMEPVQQSLDHEAQPAQSVPVAAQPVSPGPQVDASTSQGSNVAAHSGTQMRLSHERMPLIVGGSDGSGTRSVVALLEKLGVHMNVDDRGTNDVHAAEMGGWPPVVKKVLEHTHAGDYDVESLPDTLTHHVVSDLRKFINSMDKQGNRHQSKALGVSYGFKAPVSMLLVPFFLHEYGKLKFLQVVRDGRDIAFSGNQSPVTKFYDASYAAGSAKRSFPQVEVKAIQLWSDWNTDVYEWSQRHQNQPNFESLVIHTEDLIDPATKFETVRRVAGFVGADHFTNDELCCMVVQPEEFMGSHSKDVKGRGEHGNAAANKLKSRFGHWKAKLEGKPELERALLEQGDRGLQIFGYNEERKQPESSDGYVCSLTPAKCSEMGIEVPKAKPAAAKRRQGPGGTNARDSDQCKFSRGVDYKGGGGDLDVASASDPEACCHKCHSYEGCKFITYDPDQSLCYLKKSQGSIVMASGLISAEVF